MIKVLMLGWEFPPHISGGLGVACEGLTSALVESKEVQVCFIIPKTTEPGRPGKLLDIVGANTIDVPKTLPEAQNISQSSESAITNTEYRQRSFEIVSVPAEMYPYTSPVEPTDYYLEKWTSMLEQSTAVVTKVDQLQVQNDSETTRYSFQGGYGTNLLTEVDRYAGVVAELGRTREFDVIHAHDWMTFPAALHLRHISGKPLVVHIHATEFDRAGDSGSPLVYEMERLAVTQCDHVIAVSELTRQTLIGRYGADPDRILVVHNGTIPNTTLARRSIHPLGDQLVTFVGRITFQKGPEYFVDAAEKVVREFPDCRFVMAGTGDALPDIIHRVIRKRLTDRFHFAGFLSKADVGRILGYSSVYVMPSVSEPFGLTALEAIQAGVPTIVSRQSGVSEVMPDVIKVDFWDTDALAQSISGILRYPILAETMRLNASRRISGISWQKAALKVTELYETLLTRAESHSPAIL